MKLTWFGSETLRVYASGRIVVVEPDAAPPQFDRTELVSGADKVLDRAALAEMAQADPAGWRPRPFRPMDGAADLEILKIGPRSLLLWAPGEPPLVLLSEGDQAPIGRWADAAVVVLVGSAGLATRAEALLNAARPRLLALAVDEASAASALEKIAGQLDGTGLVTLEVGLAVEV